MTRKALICDVFSVRCSVPVIFLSSFAQTDFLQPKYLLHVTMLQLSKNARMDMVHVFLTGALSELVPWFGAKNYEEL